MEELAGGDVAAFRRRLDDDPATWFATPEDQLTAYRSLCKEVDARLWEVVTDLPRMPYGVEAMPDYMAVSAPTAYYVPGAGGARRPGTFIVNGHDLASRPSWRMVPLALHEAVPGHHLQHAVADELGALPPIRRHLGWNAYVEGWGLYAEHLGEELGLYRSDADRYGRLSFDMWRAARLVVDTGIHAFGWDRGRAIAYVEETTGLGHHDVVSEVDRYISWPGQALGYKLGEQVILGLRREAEVALGPGFRPQPFHDVVLGSGPVPLPVLEAEVRRWLSTTAAAT
jgi:prolyl oligopeptidase